MSLVTEVHDALLAAAHDITSKAVDFEQTVLPAAASKLTALEGNPVIDSLLNAVHVPPEALGIVVKTIDGLEALYNVPDDTTAPATPVATSVAPVVQPVQ